MSQLTWFQGLVIDEGPVQLNWHYCISYNSVWIDELVISRSGLIWRYV